MWILHDHVLSRSGHQLAKHAFFENWGQRGKSPTLKTYQLETGYHYRIHGISVSALRTAVFGPVLQFRFPRSVFWSWRRDRVLSHARQLGRAKLTSASHCLITSTNCTEGRTRKEVVQSLIYNCFGQDERVFLCENGVTYKMNFFWLEAWLSFPWVSTDSKERWKLALARQRGLSSLTKNIHALKVLEKL